MKKPFLYFFLIFFSCEKNREIAQIEYKVHSMELPDYSKRIRLDKFYTETYYLYNGDKIDFVNDPMQDRELVYSKKNDSTYVIKILFGAPEGEEFSGIIYTDRKKVFYLKPIEGKKEKSYRGLTSHIIIFEVKTKMKNPIFKNFSR